MERTYTIEATKCQEGSSISPIEKGFFNAYGIQYRVKESGKLSSHPELMPAMKDAIIDLATKNRIPHNKLTLTLSLTE